MKIEAGGYTLQGRRDENQDAHAIVHTRWGVVAAVCDGLGGHEGGREAAELAARAVWEAATSAHREESAEQLIYRAVRTAHREVRTHQKGRLSEMMTTIVVWAWRAESPTVCAVGHLGDSRAYLHRLTADAFVQLTVDHASGRHAVNRTVGSYREAGEPDVKTLTCLPGDTFLLCTDGLHGTLSDEMIRDALLDKQRRSPGFAAESLCRWALHEGSQDNITAAVVRLVP